MRGLRYDVERYKEIMKMRDEGKTYAEIGRLFGISRARIHQILTHEYKVTPEDPRETTKYVNTRSKYIPPARVWTREEDLIVMTKKTKEAAFLLNVCSTSVLKRRDQLLAESSNYEQQRE